MRIEFSTQGGVAYFPGLAKPVVIDTSELPAEEAAAIERLVDAARLWQQPAQPSGLPRGADLRQYTITVEDRDKRHTVRLHDPIADPALAALVSHLQAKMKALRRAARTDRDS